MAKQKRTHKWMAGDLVCIKQTHENPEWGVKWVEDYSLGIVLIDRNKNPRVQFRHIYGEVDCFYFNDQSLTMISEQEFEEEIIHNQ